MKPTILISLPLWTSAAWIAGKDSIWSPRARPRYGPITAEPPSEISVMAFVMVRAPV